MLEVERMIRLNSLKSKGNQKNTFASLNFNIERERDWKLSPRERFKRLNEWRIHTPTITERKNLKIPITIDKIDLLEISHFLILSGGNNHMEFSIQVILLVILILLFFLLLFYDSYSILLIIILNMLTSFILIGNGSN